MNDISRQLIFAGLVLLIAGAVLGFFGKVPGLGRLPGDIAIRRENFSFYFPLASCLLVSLALTFFFWLFGRK